MYTIFQENSEKHSSISKTLMKNILLDKSLISKSQEISLYITQNNSLQKNKLPTLLLPKPDEHSMSISILQYTLSESLFTLSKLDDNSTRYNFFKFHRQEYNGSQWFQWFHIQYHKEYMLLQTLLILLLKIYSFSWKMIKFLLYDLDF